VIAFCEQVRRVRPQASFGADLIAGFPTESDAMFDNTLNLIGESDLSFLHVFPFSARRGTPAARMPQIERATIRSRAAQLRSRGAIQLQHRLKRLLGTEQMLLIEQPGRGRSECFAPAWFVGSAEPGSCVRSRVVDAGADHLKAELLT